MRNKEREDDSSMWCACFIGRPFGCCFTRTDGTLRRRVNLVYCCRGRGEWSVRARKRKTRPRLFHSHFRRRHLVPRRLCRPNMSRRRPFPGQLRAIKNKTPPKHGQHAYLQTQIRHNDVFVQSRGATADAVLNVL